jgi:hypothetical protein
MLKSLPVLQMVSCFAQASINVAFCMLSDPFVLPASALPRGASFSLPVTLIEIWKPRHGSFQVVERTFLSILLSLTLFLS